MSRARVLRSFAPVVVLGLLFISCSEQEDEANDPDRDSATLRRQAMDEWYNETATQKSYAEGGPWSASSARTCSMPPRSSASAGARSCPAGVKQTLIQGSSWSSLGPTQAHTLQNGATTLMVTDSGRVPNDHRRRDASSTSPPPAAACGGARAAPGRR